MCWRLFNVLSGTLMVFSTGRASSVYILMILMIDTSEIYLLL